MTGRADPPRWTARLFFGMIALMSSRTPPPDDFPRDKDELLRDFTVANRLKDIRDAENLKDGLAPRWWETLVGVMQFAAALGLLASLVQHPQLREDTLARLIVFWVVLMILSLVLGFEFMILKLYSLRRAYEVQLRLLDGLRRHVEELEKQVREARTGQAGAGPAAPESPHPRD